MGVFESEIQLIFDEIISANYSEYQEHWITVDGKSLKNTLTNYEQNGQNMLVTVSGQGLETKLPTLNTVDSWLFLFFWPEIAEL